MTDYDHFPTPADIAPKDFTTPPLDPKWEALVMDEIAAHLRKKQPELQAKRQVRFVPVARRDMGHAREQWLHFARHIADLVREKGWVVMVIEGGSYPTLSISMPKPDDVRPGRTLDALDKRIFE